MGKTVTLPPGSVACHDRSVTTSTHLHSHDPTRHCSQLEDGGFSWMIPEAPVCDGGTSRYDRECARDLRRHFFSCGNRKSQFGMFLSNHVGDVYSGKPHSYRESRSVTQRPPFRASGKTPIRKHEYRSVEPRETSDRVQSSRIRPASARPSTGKPNTLRDRPSSADGFGPRPSWIPDPYSKSVDPKPSRFKSSRGGECFDSNPFGLKKSTPEKTVGTLDGGRDVKQSERDRSTLSRSRPRSAPIQRSTYRVRLHDTFSPTPEYIPSPYRDNPLACRSSVESRREKPTKWRNHDTHSKHSSTVFHNEFHGRHRF